MVNSPHCGAKLDPDTPETPKTPATTEAPAPPHSGRQTATGAGDTSSTSASPLPPEFDHRGIRLPARTRVGGIIIPQ